MSRSVFAFSRRGLATAERVSEALGGASVYAPERLAGGNVLPIPSPSFGFFAGRFAADGALIFVGSCGIAVRLIAPHIRSKTEDPAVLVIDELGRHVIPILSGHIGGANALAKLTAQRLGAEAVITTATDINGRFSVDAWAAENGFSISGMGLVKEVSAAILEGEVPVLCDLPVSGELPKGLRTGDGELGILVSYRKDEPFTRTLRIVPKCVILGVGCRRGTPCKAIEAAVGEALENAGIDPASVKAAASIDLKSGEAGLLGFCEKHGIPVEFYSAGRLNEVEGDFTRSDFVKGITGVDNVCERAAMAAGTRLIMRKTVRGGVTVAAALDDTEVRFG